MAEIVPNRVPCSKRIDPQPKPEPKPPVVLCELSGVTYFKLRSDIPGDYTKNCGLLGDEIDKNFYFLRSMDILSAYTVVEDNRKYLVLERINCGRDIKVDITDEDAYDHNFRVEDGYIYVRYPGGEEDPIRDGNGTIGDGNPVKFLREGDNIRVVTDASINGDGTFRNPIGLDLAYRTGEYAPADFYADLTCPEVNINDVGTGIGNGHAIVTKETMSRFGALYTWRQAMAINAALAKEGRGWRVPSKEDWAKLLNWAELDPSPCVDCGDVPANFNHDTDKSGNFGCNAGARLKTTTLWENSERNTDDFGFSIYPVGICPEDYNTREPNQYGFTGLYKTASYWTTSEKDGEAYVRTFSYGHDDVAQFTESPARRLSIRLVRDIVDDFDVQEYAEILGNYAPVILTTNGTQQWTQLNIDFANYEGYKADEVTVPNAWNDVSTEIPATWYYQLVESGDTYDYVEIDKYDLPSTANPVAFESIEEALEAPVLEPFISIEVIVVLDMVTEAKFYYNAWDGNRWHKKMMKPGETVVLLYPDAETPCSGETYVTSANTDHEWQVYFNEKTGLDELVDVAEAIKREISGGLKEVWEHISGLTEGLNNLSGFVSDMYDEMQSGFTSAFTAIDNLQEELDRTEEAVGLDEDGNYIIPECGLTSASTSVMEAIAILDDATLQNMDDINVLSGVVEDLINSKTELQDEVDRIEAGVGLDEDGNFIPNEGYFTSGATSVEEEIAALDDKLKEVADEVEEFKDKAIVPMDESIVVEVTGNTTYIGVQIDSEDKHLIIGEHGIWFDGDFGLI